MRTVIANIGLNTGAKYGEVVAFNPVVALTALQVVLERGRETVEDILTYKVEQSETEATLVVTVQIKGRPDGFFRNVAEILKQEAIAYYVVEEQKGYLVGEYADSWGGEFNPEYFLI